MIDGSEKRNRQLAFELQNSHVCEKRSKIAINAKIEFSSSFMYTNEYSFSHGKCIK